MESSLVAKQANKLIESVYRMEVEEQKLILLATRKINELELKGLPFTPETEVVITADEFAKIYGVPKQRAFEALTSAKNTIYDRSFEMDYVGNDGVIKPISSRWIHAKGEMKSKSEVSMFFTPSVIPYLYLVVKTEFTLLDLKEVGRLKNKYAVRLYQILMKWRNAEYQPSFPVESLRRKLGLEPHEYKQGGDFNKRVVGVAVDQINKGTGFVGLKAVPLKNGRTIVAYRFEFDSYDNKTINITPLSKNGAERQPRENNGEFVLHQMTVEQIKTFSSQIANKVVDGETGFSHLSTKVAAGSSSKELAAAIAKDLQNANFDEYLEPLKILGFKPTKVNKTPLGAKQGENKGGSTNDTPPDKKSPFNLNEKHYQMYLKKGGTKSRDDIVRIAMDEDTTTLHVMNSNGVGNIFAM